MKRPTPRQFGLDSDHSPLGISAANLSVDPAQPFTEQELEGALNALIVREALAHRQREYSRALSEWDYNNGGR